ncbi:MAG TPA: rod shape-determining protein MreD [Gammaproteobacteria bacterium]|nr:rod shape-determining protein MreD [Gammaproteobacteria bacterium]
MTRWKYALTLFLSLTAALTLAVVPVPVWLHDYAPDWAVMTVVWWNLHRPNKASVGVGWLTGLALDILRFTTLGLHAFATTATSYFAVRINLQFRMFAVVQKILIVLLLLAIYRIILFWISGLAGNAVSSPAHWKPLLADLLVWPWLNALMHEILRRIEAKPATEN